MDVKVFFSVQKEQVLTVQDPTSDIAVLSRKEALFAHRDALFEDRSKMRKRFWELGGTRMGNLLGVEKNVTEQDIQDSKEKQVEFNDNGEVDYKKLNSFKHLVEKANNQEAVSDFGKSLTLKQQREFLPIFSVEMSYCG